MKIVKLEQDIIKVILWDTDLIDMNMDAKNINENSPELGSFLNKIIKLVRDETGFSLDNSKVTVEAATFDNGIVLFLYKEKSLHGTKQKPKLSKAKTERVIFEFIDFDVFCEFVSNSSFACLSGMRLYRYNSRFYISINRENIPFLIYEYSFRNRKAKITESFLKEHGKLIANGKRLTNIISMLKNTK